MLRAAAHCRARLHPALHSGARGPRDAGLVVLAALDASGDRGHAARLHRGGRRDGRYGCGHLRRHFVRADKQRGVAGLVTDGVVRDIAGVQAGLNVWCQGAAAPPSVAGLTFVNWQEPIGCGGVAVYPDDIVVVDDDGAVLIPAALLEDVVRVAPEQERMETWIMDEVTNGAKLPGLYPPNEENLKRYKDWVSIR